MYIDKIMIIDTLQATILLLTLFNSIKSHNCSKNESVGQFFNQKEMYNDEFAHQKF